MNPFRRSRSADPKQLIETAFRQAALAVGRPKYTGTKKEKAVQKEGVRIKSAGSTIHSNLKSIAKSWPDTDRLTPIYTELAAIAGRTKLKKAVGFVNQTANQIKDLQMTALRKVKYARDTFAARHVRQEFYGRAVAYIKHASRELDYLDGVAKLLRGLPDFQDLPTVIIAGLPNVGKSSLLNALTGSAPEIAPWPFTTRGLMLGYTEWNFQKVQFVDTPGLLDRPAAKRSRIEMQAVVVLKVLADMIIYIFDPSETCGSTIEQQLRQYDEIKQAFKKPIIPVANKIDVIGGRPVEDIGVKVSPVSCTTGEGIEDLKKLVREKIKPA